MITQKLHPQVCWLTSLMELTKCVATHPVIGRHTQTEVAKSVHKKVGSNKTCSAARSGSHMCQELSLDQISSDTQEELPSQLIKATERNQFWINSFAYQIQSLQDSLPEVTWDYAYFMYACMSLLLIIMSSNTDNAQEYVFTLLECLFLTIISSLSCIYEAYD